MLAQARAANCRRASREIMHAHAPGIRPVTSAFDGQLLLTPAPNMRTARTAAGLHGPPSNVPRGHSAFGLHVRLRLGVVLSVTCANVRCRHYTAASAFARILRLHRCRAS